jgi:hypothetical protein
VNGIRSPGKAILSGVATPWKYDVQESYGRSGAVVVFRGRGIAKFTLTIVMWTRVHFIEWPFFSKLLEPPSFGKPLVVEMRHPILSSADIKAVAVEQLGQPEKQPNGTWVATIQCLEYRPPLPALVKPRGAIPSVDKGVPITPKTEADLALVQATQDFETARSSAR